MNRGGLLGGLGGAGAVQGCDARRRGEGRAAAIPERVLAGV